MCIRDRVSVFRQLFPDQMPSVFERFNAMHLEALDAPCAAALVAVRGNSVDFETIRRIKLYVRSDPIYFNEAFDARFIELGKLHRT